MGDLISLDDVRARRPSIELSADQASALAEILDWAQSSEGDPILTLSGHAGTGKSTLVQEIAKRFGRPLAQCAPTHKALKVMREMAERHGVPEHLVQFYTVASFGGLRLMDDAPERYLARGIATRFEEGFRLVIVDEASMVGKKIYDLIDTEARAHGARVLFVGDPYQLPPVKDEEGGAFKHRMVKLTKIVRQAEGNPIIALGNHFRRLILGEIPPATPPPIVQRPDGTGVRMISGRDFYPGFVEAVARGIDNPGEARALAYTNERVDHLAALARARVHGEGCPAFVRGERVFAKEKIKAKNLADCKGAPRGMYTDQEATVVQVSAPAPHPEYPEFRAIPIVVRTDDDRTLAAWALDPTEGARFEARITELRRTASGYQPATYEAKSAWRTHWAFHDAFALLRSVHATTIHKSQGSTFEEVFVDLEDVNRVRDPIERWRMLYVACTRARRTAWLRT